MVTCKILDFRHLPGPFYDVPKKHRMFVAATLAFSLGVVGLVILRSSPREPVYQGRPLTFWLNQYRSAAITNPWPLNKEEEKEPKDAIRHIGTNAIPTLLKLITARESPVIEKLFIKFPIQGRIWLNFHGVDAYRAIIHARQELGAYGFRALAEDAKPAVPALIALLDDNDLRVRCETLLAVGHIRSAAKDAVPRLITCLHDPSWLVRLGAVQALGEIHQEPKRVIPALRNFLQKRPPRPFITLESLGAFGPQATSAVPIVMEFLNDKETKVRFAATNALREIEPESAAK